MSRTWNERNHYTLRYQSRQIFYYKNLSFHYDDASEIEVAPHRKGRFRKHSYKDCGVSRCPICDNPRRLRTYSGVDKITIQERKANVSKDYFSKYDPFDDINLDDSPE